MRSAGALRMKAVMLHASAAAAAGFPERGDAGTAGLRHCQQPPLDEAAGDSDNWQPTWPWPRLLHSMIKFTHVSRRLEWWQLPASYDGSGAG